MDEIELKYMIIEDIEEEREESQVFAGTFAGFNHVNITNLKISLFDKLLDKNVLFVIKPYKTSDYSGYNETGNTLKSDILIDIIRDLTNGYEKTVTDFINGYYKKYFKDYMLYITYDDEDEILLNKMTFVFSRDKDKIKKNENCNIIDLSDGITNIHDIYLEVNIKNEYLKSIKNNIDNYFNQNLKTNCLHFKYLFDVINLLPNTYIIINDNLNIQKFIDYLDNDIYDIFDK